MEYVLFVLYFSFFLCLCALVCLYFSGCQEMTYRHEGRRPAVRGKPLPVTRSPFLGPRSLEMTQRRGERGLRGCVLGWERALFLSVPFHRPKTSTSVYSRCRWRRNALFSRHFCPNCIFKIWVSW